jgi:hypothetical protein
LSASVRSRQLETLGPSTCLSESKVTSRVDPTFHAQVAPTRPHTAIACVFPGRARTGEHAP